MTNNNNMGHRSDNWMGAGVRIACAGVSLGLALVAQDAEAATNVASTCEATAFSLDELVSCISEHMPAKDSDGFVLPSTIADAEADWRTLVSDLVAMDEISDCDTISVPSALVGIYEVLPFYDSYRGREYCVAMEVLDGDDDGAVDYGWGTLIVDPTPERLLSIDIPHPLADNDTNVEGVAIFAGVGAHTFLMAGSHREANDADSSACQADEHESDVAHAIDNLFFPAAAEIDDYFSAALLDHTAIQFHGMDAEANDSGCNGVDVYITHGSGNAPTPGDSIVGLKSSLLAQEPSWTVVNPGDSPSCGKNGAKNVEGRYINAGDESLVCGSNLGSYSGRFIHIEQHIDNDLTTYRNPRTWIAAIEGAFAPLSPPPLTSTISFQNGAAPTASYAGMTDTYLEADDTDDNNGDKGACEVDGDIGDEKWQALRWDVSAIPPGSMIDEVTVTIEVTSATDAIGYYAYPLHRPWSEDDATWDEYDDGLDWQSGGASGAADRESTPVALWAPQSKGTHTVSLNPDLVQAWLDFPSLNDGILLANPANDDGLDFHSSEATTVTKRPKLTVVYH